MLGRRVKLSSRYFYFILKLNLNNKANLFIKWWWTSPLLNLTTTTTSEKVQILFTFDFYFCWSRIGLFKGGLSLKNTNKLIHLYFIVTKYWWNNDLVEDIDNWTRSYTLVLYTNIDLKLRNKSHEPMHYKIRVICVYNGHVFYTLL